jgi:hypothetical protein
MTETAPSDLARHVFRAGNGYQLVVYDRLPPHEQAVLAELRADPGFYGVLKPTAGSHRTLKAVGKDTALLWWTLSTPGPLPAFVWSGDREEAAREIRELVLDGVLEVQQGERFVAGPEAAGLLQAVGGDRPRNRLARLSIEALRHGESLGETDRELLAARLYAYHRQPLTPAWNQRLADREAVLGFLGAGPGTALRRQLDGPWREASPEESPHWLAWAPRRPARRGGAADRPTYKLYVSPRIEALPEVFAQTVAGLAHRGGSFKVGGDAAGLLRPDKLVLYFGDPEELQAVAAELGRRLAGAPTQGVPFTAEIGGDGLLSWGLDPPAAEPRLPWEAAVSWRLWVVRRLAAALVAARGEDPDSAAGAGPPADRPAPWQFALARLRHEGIDVDRWTPSPHLFTAS